MRWTFAVTAPPDRAAISTTSDSLTTTSAMPWLWSNHRARPAGSGCGLLKTTGLGPTSACTILMSVAGVKEVEAAVGEDDALGGAMGASEALHGLF